jgi:hypothetical protein
MLRLFTVAAALAVLSNAASAQLACQQFGNQTYCNNGQRFSSFGNQMYDNRGNNWQTYGNTTYGPGGPYQTFGTHTYTPQGAYQTYGNTTYGPQGSNCSSFGRAIYCR